MRARLERGLAGNYSGAGSPVSTDVPAGIAREECILTRARDVQRRLFGQLPDFAHQLLAHEVRLGGARASSARQGATGQEALGRPARADGASGRRQRTALATTSTPSVDVATVSAARSCAAWLLYKRRLHEAPARVSRGASAAREPPAPVGPGHSWPGAGPGMGMVRKDGEEVVVPQGQVRVQKHGELVQRRLERVAWRQRRALDCVGPRRGRRVQHDGQQAPVICRAVPRLQGVVPVSARSMLTCVFLWAPACDAYALPSAVTAAALRAAVAILVGGSASDSSGSACQRASSIRLVGPWQAAAAPVLALPVVRFGLSVRVRDRVRVRDFSCGAKKAEGQSRRCDMDEQTPRADV